MDDPYRLERFVAAQDEVGTFQRAVTELRAGAKRGHWMWFVFPQIAGLGTSSTARHYAITSLDEARAYLAHPVLGTRLRECARIVADTEGRTAEQIFGLIDALKLRSSMTLFAEAEAEAEAEAGETAFREVLVKFFGGVPDEATLTRLLERSATHLRAGITRPVITTLASLVAQRQISGVHPALPVAGGPVMLAR